MLTLKTVFIITVVVLPVAQTWADSRLTDAENIRNGTQLAKEGRHQKAYDLYFKDLSSTPKNLAWLAAYKKKFNIRDPNDDMSPQDIKLIKQGTILAKEGRHQEAYDLYFKNLSPTPYFLSWQERYRKRFGVTEKEEVQYGSSRTPMETAALGPRRFPARAKVLLGLGALTGISSWAAILIQRKAVEDYNDLYERINDTTLANYELLVSERKSLQAKTNMAQYLGAAAGTLLAYTVLDALVFHQFFPRRIKSSVARDKIQVAMEIKF